MENIDGLIIIFISFLILVLISSTVILFSFKQRFNRHRSEEEEKICREARKVKDNNEGIISNQFQDKYPRVSDQKLHYLLESQEDSGIDGTENTISISSDNSLSVDDEYQHTEISPGQVPPFKECKRYMETHFDYFGDNLRDTNENADISRETMQNLGLQKSCIV